ncbi:MAG: nucleotidyltransferase domain-containing protein [Planctomycetes bacterium]|nr:nucleotidyltransferase domain-containing protein [Planctomycetota bacterium]
MSPRAVARKAELEQALRQIVVNLVERYRPQCIILYGLLARGECGEWSDIDLCVIKETDEPFVKRAVEADLATERTVAMDFVVYTPAEWRQMLANGNYFVRDEILAKGKVLYGRPE